MAATRVIRGLLRCACACLHQVAPTCTKKIIAGPNLINPDQSGATARLNNRVQHSSLIRQIVAVCCTVLQRVAPCFAQKSFQTSGATPPRSILPTVGPVSRPAGPEAFLPRSTATPRQTSRTWA